MTGIIISFFCISSLICFHILELLKINRIHNRLKNRICVTGTRGKSSTARLITAILQHTGNKTLGKVSGSKPVLIKPDGTQTTIKRKGKPSITEQIKVVLKTADKLSVNCLVSEIMSITPEFQICETRKILNPNILIITNVRDDHLGTTGNNVEEIAKVFLKSAPDDCRIIMLASEWDTLSFTSKPENLILVSETEVNKIKKEYKYTGFTENLALAIKACELTGINISPSIFAEVRVTEDIGESRIWKLSEKSFAVNAFAANEPVSTLKVMEKSILKLPESNYKKIGLMVLRTDKGERTLQWCKFLSENENIFDELYITGGHAAAAAKKLKNLHPVVLSDKNIGKLHDDYLLGNDKVIFGFGNLVGKGEEYIKYWERTGDII